MSRRWVLLLAATILVPAPAALAQGPGAQSIVADPDGMNRELDAAAARKICWERGKARGADGVAEVDPAYRREVMGRYLMEETESGWRWLPAALAGRTDVRSSSSAEGYTDRVLVVDLEDPARGRARLRVDGPLSRGEVELEWSVPPERVCLVDELDLEAGARVVEGSPGSYGIVFILPLTPDLLEARGEDVKACSPGSETLVDSEAGPTEDAGRCRRPLLHLRPGSRWAVWVGLPESFYVVYPYEPRNGR